MNVKGKIVPSTRLSSILQNQMFDIDMNGFPVLSDKNIALINLLFDNDSSYAKGDAYEEETTVIFKGMFSQDHNAAEENVRRAVYRINRDNSTSLPTLSSAGKEKNKSEKKLTQREIIDRLGISNKIVAEKNGGKEKYITGGSLLTAEAINQMIQQGIHDDAGRSFRQLLLEGEPKLVYLIAHAAEKAVNDCLGSTEERINKNNFSFATKFCHHVCKRIGDENQDNRYCIYDSVVHEFLPYYACEYLDAGALNGICDYRDFDFKSSFVTPEEKYKKVVGQIGRWKDYVAQDASEKDGGYGYVSYRKLYDAVLDAINNWRAARRYCPAHRADIIVCFPEEKNYDKLNYADLDRFIWYFFKNQRRKEKVRK